jgi:hypothetical protein
MAFVKIPDLALGAQGVSLPTGFDTQSNESFSAQQSSVVITPTDLVEHFDSLGDDTEGLASFAVFVGDELLDAGTPEPLLIESESVAFDAYGPFFVVSDFVITDVSFVVVDPPDAVSDMIRVDSFAPLLPSVDFTPFGYCSLVAPLMCAFPPTTLPIRNLDDTDACPTRISPPVLSDADSCQITLPPVAARNADDSPVCLSPTDLGDHSRDASFSLGAVYGTDPNNAPDLLGISLRRSADAPRGDFTSFSHTQFFRFPGRTFL